MSILIINAKMPESCDDCFALDDYGDYPFCLISQDQRGYNFNTRAGRMPSCPLVEAPTSQSTSKFVDCDAAIKAITSRFDEALGVDDAVDVLSSLPAEDVVLRDDGIKMGAELAAMHGSDATSLDLEKAFWRGFEEAMKKRDVRPVVRGKWKIISFMTVQCSNCKETYHELEGDNFCPNCGAMMEES